MDVALSVPVAVLSVEAIALRVSEPERLTVPLLVLLADVDVSVELDVVAEDAEELVVDVDFPNVVVDSRSFSVSSVVL